MHKASVLFHFLFDCQKAIVNSSGFFIFVALEPPQIRSFQTVNSKLNGDATLTCVVGGKPFPNVMWKREGRQIFEGRRHKIQTRADGTVNLMITKVEADDDGEYTVEAVNEAGKDKKTANLCVQCKLDIVIRFELKPTY